MAAWDAIVVGGGVVGCAVLRELTIRLGLRCLLLEASPHLVAGASSGNTGIACTPSDVPEHTTERQCLLEGVALNDAAYTALNVPHRRTGSMYVGHTQEELQSLATELATREGRGDHSCSILSPKQAREIEPALDASSLTGALHVPGEIVVDPWLVPIAYARHAHENGATIRRGTEVTAAAWGDGCWRLSLSSTAALASPNVEGAEGAGEERGEETARLVVACGGLRGDELEGLHRPPPFAIRPRRGDFILFDESAGAAIGDTPIGGPPSATSRGPYVWRSAHGVIACGPTAEEVSERVTPPSPTDPAVREALRQAATRAIPALSACAVAGTYAGLRPATDATSDYLIERAPGSSWVSVGGVRSTGLTASLGIARHVARLCEEALQETGRDGEERCRSPEPVRTTPLPPVDAIVQSFRDRADGSVVFGEDEMGFGAHHVTHPLTRAGFTRLAGLTGSRTVP